ncbi:hypothetical protein CKAH01_07752 [Colletotrichum kahawae]|uniref:Uncharacterized protein n=1 Tax=Colletotrichum kahawae TaxID=34407 RepID=A0AAD9Y6M6_COLKA|nr:hypothetical protein CKAH01_07752 [Colletotrichum kahawae]
MRSSVSRQRATPATASDRGHSSSARTSQQRDKRNDAKNLFQLVKRKRTRTPLIVPPNSCISSLLPHAIPALSLLAGSLIMNKVAIAGGCAAQSQHPGS